MSYPEHVRRTRCLQKSNEARALRQTDQISEDATGNVDDVSAASDGEQLRVLLSQGTSAD